MNVNSIFSETKNDDRSFVEGKKKLKISLFRQMILSIVLECETIQEQITKLSTMLERIKQNTCSSSIASTASSRSVILSERTKRSTVYSRL